ncbi:nuclear pore complex protein-like protein Nup107 [Pleomassaria siparia CBS 279.74]|uniref:Nuclear pore complex protein n=1 Tax=Pleomassaria siparia CBS 279.74 TaxID=1314801 RepID=A0A6G1K884_9PLEO|nr:nuclear pore complex protein-like protein Nup107 [Pleomassaria siparia CBS 279.74]
MFLTSRRSQSAAVQLNSSRSTPFSASRAATDAISKDDPLQPLRTVADRVGKEVEEFAERVDHFHTRTNISDKKVWHTETLRMVGRFEDLAESKVKELKKQADAENKGELNKSLRRRIQKMAESPNLNSGNDLRRSFQPAMSVIESSSTPESLSVQELRQWEAELATWELLRITLQQHYPAPATNVAQENQARLAQAGGVHRYTPNREIWNRFLLADEEAREKETILRWLEETARKSESAVESITEQLKAQSGKDTHIWTSGWLDTKSKLKQAKRIDFKRVETSDGPLNSNVSLRTGDGAKLLVTHLDPDAPTRQNRDLEKSDDYYERSLWMVCYEMMRRGKPWQDIAEWCKERNEAWRGVSIGAAYESHPDNGPNVSGPTVGYLFRRTCFFAARGARSPYECAVYGLLSGDLASAETVCRTWDDHLYARYNSLLLSRFDSYLRNTPRVSKKTAMQFGFTDEVALVGDWENSSRLVIENLKEQKATSAQARAPMKLIQGSLISWSVDELVCKVGVAIASLFQEDDRPLNLSIDPESDPSSPTANTGTTIDKRQYTAEEYYQQFATDPDALRVLVHIFITVKHLPSFGEKQWHQLAAMDNVITLYIEFLRITKKISLIPLYAARLETKRTIHCLARILPDIKNADEQKSFVKLMELYRINAIPVITKNCELSLASTDFGSATFDPEKVSISRFEMLEQIKQTTSHKKIWPGQRIKLEMPGLDIDQKEESLIESLRWYDHIESDYVNTFERLSESLQYLLLTGRIGAAEQLISEMNIESLAPGRTQAHCGYPFDFTAPGMEEQDELQVVQIIRTTKRGQPSQRLSDIPSADEHAAHVENMRACSATYQELQQLVRLITLFREWRQEENNLVQFEGTKVDSKPIKEMFEAIQATFDSLLECVDPHANGRMLYEIRKAYYPEMVIAYICVAQTAGFFIQRDYIVKAMDIANMVADADKEWLQVLFMKTGRMTELVDTLALASRAMLRLSDLGDAKKLSAKKRGSRGESLRAWDLKSRN